nr:hypothetical protein [uncultured Desulfobulbus sp.]
MMQEDQDNEPFFDDDPALDYILYEEMTNERQPQHRPGCFGVVLLCWVIPASWVCWMIL